MQEEKEVETTSNRQVADSGGKIIFENPTLCSQLLSSYSGLDFLKGIKPEDIEDVTERFIPMFTEQRDADVVKKVHLSDEDVFIALIEHKSGVDYNVAMQILRYMIYIWEDYEKQMEAVHPGISHTKSFKYPPVLPIIYYEGDSSWTVEDSFRSRIALNEIFSEFIPDFKYHLISLGAFGREDLIKRSDGMSFVMLINRIRNDKEFRELNLPKEYMYKLLEGSPDDVITVIAKVIAVILRKHNIPENDIQNLVDQLKERKSMALFDNYVASFDAQEERRLGADEMLIKLICSKLRKGISQEVIKDQLSESGSDVAHMIEVACKHAPDYNIQDIMKDLNCVIAK